MSKFDSDIVFSIISEYYRYSKRVPMRLVQFNREISFSVWYRSWIFKIFPLSVKEALLSESTHFRGNLEYSNEFALIAYFFITLCHTRFILPLGISKCNFEPMEAFLNRTNHKICQNMVGEGLLNPIQCIRSSYRGSGRPCVGNHFLRQFLL